MSCWAGQRQRTGVGRTCQAPKSVHEGSSCRLRRKSKCPPVGATIRAPHGAALTKHMPPPLQAQAPGPAPLHPPAPLACVCHALQ